MLEESKYNKGEGMDDATKIQHLKTGIKIDPGIEHALTQMRAQPANYLTFTQVTTFLLELERLSTSSSGVPNLRLLLPVGMYPRLERTSPPK